MMKNFQGLNQLLKGADQNPIGDLASSLVDASRSRVNAVTSAADGYARSYVMVQELSVNAEGQVVDQTDDARQEVATNALRSVQLQLKEQRARVDALTNEINKLAPSSTDVQMKFKVPKSIAKWEGLGNNQMHTFGSFKQAGASDVRDLITFYRMSYGSSHYLNPVPQGGVPEHAVRHGSLTLYTDLRGNIDVSTNDYDNYAACSMSVVFDTISTEENYDGLLGRNFALSSLLHMLPVSETVHIPTDAFSKDIDGLFGLTMKFIRVTGTSNWDLAFIVGVAVTRRNGVSDENIDAVSGAREFANTHENKVFCGSVYTWDTQKGDLVGHVITGATSWLTTIRPNMVDRVTTFITQLTETPYEQDTSASFEGIVEKLLTLPNSPAFRAMLPNVDNRYGTIVPTANPTKYGWVRRAIVDSRWHHIMYDPDSIESLPDSQIAAFVSPWTTLVLGSAHLRKESDSSIRLLNFIDYASELNGYMYWFGFPGDINIQIDDKNFSNYLPPANVSEDSSVQTTEYGQVQLGTALADAILLSNQTEIEDSLLAM